jgi:hypothetical protein
MLFRPNQIIHLINITIRVELCSKLSKPQENEVKFQILTIYNEYKTILKKEQNVTIYQS